MFKLIILFALLFTGCFLQNGDDNGLEFIIDADGERVTLRWEKPRDKDVAGYIVYYGEITSYRALVPPPHVGIVNGFDNQIDVGYVTSVTFIMDVTKFYQFFLRAYDKNRELGETSKCKYHPYNPMTNLNSIELFADPWHGYLHKIGGPFSVAWDANDPAEEVVKYDVKAIFINDPTHITTYQHGETGGLSLEVTRQGPVGLYEFYVRACDASENCSEWNSSDEIEGSSVSVAGELVPGNWIVYWMLAAPVWE